MNRQIINKNGKRYVLVEPDELRKLERLAAKSKGVGLPPWPPADADGNFPAVEYARVSIARSIIEERHSLGLSQEELARISGLRQETISRLESGKHSPTIRTVDKIDAAFKSIAAQRSTDRGKRGGKKARVPVRRGK